MGIADTVAPKSDQLDAIDLTEPMTFTVTRVDVNESAEQPVTVHLAEFPRPWKPGKNMRRVLIGVWGKDERAYVGRRLTLFNNPKVKWAGKEVGGSRISHMSHIDKQVSVQVMVTQGQYATYKVEPLVESAKPTQGELNVAACDSIPQLREAWKHADPEQKKRIQARVKEIEAEALQAEHDAAVDPADLDPEADKQYTLDDEVGA